MKTIVTIQFKNTLIRKAFKNYNQANEYMITKVDAIYEKHNVIANYSIKKHV